MKMIVVNTPDLSDQGGVANHYLGLKKYFSKNVVYYQYKTSGYIKRRYKINNNTLLSLLRFSYLVGDIIRFLCVLLQTRRPIVLLNPSFYERALNRDKIYLSISKLFRCKTAVFVHGWNRNYVSDMIWHKEKFKRIWGKADGFIVLGSEFENYLRQLGITAPIYRATTKYDDEMTAVDVIDVAPSQRANILFLARIIKEKGIYLALDAFAVVQKKMPEVSMTVVGDGEELQAAQEYVKNNSIKNVLFTGHLTGRELVNVFKNATIYILPTTHGEGMPTSLIEAMAFGLPVITRPVGGVVDFFEEGSMGFLIENLEPELYAEKMLYLLYNPDEAVKIGCYNKEYAKQHFAASIVAKNLEVILNELNQDTNAV